MKTTEKKKKKLAKKIKPLRVKKVNTYTKFLPLDDTFWDEEDEEDDAPATKKATKTSAKPSAKNAKKTKKSESKRTVAPCLRCGKKVDKEYYLCHGCNKIVCDRCDAAAQSGMACDCA